MKTTLFAMLVVLFLACMPGSARADGAEMFDKKCAGCHGKDGKGQTAMGKKLSIKDLTDAKVQAAAKDDAWEKSITDGVKDSAGKVVMTGFKGKIAPEDIKALVKVCREFKGK